VADEREPIVERVEQVEVDEGAPPPPPVGPGDREQRYVRESETTRQRADGAIETDRIRVEDRRRSNGEIVGIVLIVLALLAAGAFAAWWFLARDDSKSVPAVEGLSSTQAVSRLQEDGFVAQTTTQPSDNVPAGQVVDQQPGAGTDADKGSTVSLVVSGGPTSVDVPNAVGLPEADARDRLVAAGLQVTSNEVFSDKPVGTVVAQSPAAGAQADNDAQVTINVSKGTGLVDVPNVVGQTRGEAEAALSSAGLEADVAEVPSAQPEGTVVAQHPVGGTVDKGSAVRINVSLGQ